MHGNEKYCSYILKKRSLAFRTLCNMLIFLFFIFCIILVLRVAWNIRRSEREGGAMALHVAIVCYSMSCQGESFHAWVGGQVWSFLGSPAAWPSPRISAPRSFPIWRCTRSVQVASRACLSALCWRLSCLPELGNSRICRQGHTCFRRSLWESFRRRLHQSNWKWHESKSPLAQQRNPGQLCHRQR